MHKFDHLRLVRDLRKLSISDSRPFDAIYLSTKGRAQLARELVEMLEELGRPVRVLATSIDDVPFHAMPASDLDVFLVKPSVADIQSPLLSHRFAFDSIRHQKWDLHCKRNAALAHARINGSKRILFIDDDIRSLSIDLLKRLESALDHVAIAGCTSTIGELDNSVVSHACRALGYEQSVFLSGGCLAVDLEKVSSIFAPIFNEDWIFIFESLLTADVGMVGEVEQLVSRHDDVAEEAVFQEYGEIIAEGLMAALPGSADLIYEHGYWRSYLESRRRLLAAMVDGLSQPEHESAHEMRRALVKAFDVLNDTLPNDCVNYLQLLRQETERRNSLVRAMGAEDPTLLNVVSVRPRSIRSAASKARESTGTVFRYAEYSTVTIVCPDLPIHLRTPLSLAGDLNVTRSFRLADLDAAMELLTHVQKHNPTASVRVLSAAEVDPELLVEHLILLGGAAWNAMTAWFLELLELPVQQRCDEHDQRPDSDIFFTAVDGVRVEYAPHLVRVGGRIGEAHARSSGHDVSLFARARNPFNDGRTVTICNGVLSHGVLGAVRSFTDQALGPANTAHVLSQTDGATYCLLARAQIVNDQALPIDLTNSANRLFEWTALANGEVVEEGASTREGGSTRESENSASGSATARSVTGERAGWP